MSNFEINLYSNKREFHSYSTDDFALLEIGIGNYNISSLANFLSLKEEDFTTIKPLNPDVKEFFSERSGSTIANRLSGETFLDRMKIMDFDIEEKIYKEIVGFSNIIRINQNKYKPDKFTSPEATTIKEFLKQWNQIQQGYITDPKIVNGYKVIAYRIQNSLSGCITFDTDLIILNNPRTSLIKLNLLDNADNDSSRTIAINGSPFINAVPQTPYGAEYSFRGTENSPTAAYAKPLAGGKDNPLNTAAGKMRTVYDPSTGEFESGTQQMLARLLEDIDTADIPELTAEELKGLSRDQIYDAGPDSPGYMGNFTKGKAIPLTTENGNPHMFGPDFQGGCEGDNKVQITVINRLNQSYKAGAIVVVSRMLGESGNWIIISPGTPSSTKKIKFGNFEYQRYIVPLNWFFTIPKTAAVLTPDIWLSKFRANYYAAFLNNPIDNENTYSNYIGDMNLIVKLNVLLPTVSDSDNPELDLLNLYGTDEANNIITDTFKNKNFLENNEDGLFYTTLVNSHGNLSVDKFLIRDNYSPIGCWPKNYLRKSVLVYNLHSMRGSTAIVKDNDIADRDIPGFWGILFSDGYKIEQCKQFHDKVKDTLILGKGDKGIPGDPNLSELTYLSTRCIPYFKDTAQALLFIQNVTGNLVNTTKPGKYQNLIRKSGGSYVDNKFVIYDESTMIKSINDFVECKFEGGINIGIPYILSDDIIDNHICGLEPVNPAKMQFSPLSLDHLYASALLNNIDFEYIKGHFDVWQSPTTSPTYNFNLDTNQPNLYEFLKTNDPITSLARVVANEFAPDAGNIYTLYGLSYYDTFDLNSVTSQTLNRHRAPAGIIQGVAKGIIPPVRGNARCPVVPILACKSTISTNASSLLFEINQCFGVIQKKTVTGGQSGGVVILPIGGGLVWQTPDNPIRVNTTIQWGDSNGTDNIDSLGTTALHVRVFESWPTNQTMYFGNIFTPIHFNPSTPGFKYEIEQHEDGRINVKKSLDENNNPIIDRSDVDFRLPTTKDGSVFPIFTVINKDALAPMSQWKWTGIRRAKFLSGGGFVYLKPVFAIWKVFLKNGGTGYQQNTQFTYEDGTSFKVDVDSNGTIINLKDIQYGNKSGILNNNNPGIFTTDPVPTKSESGGSGAIFDTEILVAGKICIDKGPKEVSNIKRLTKSSNGGADYENPDGVSTTVIDISDETVSLPKKYDIFYFFHNDPTHYTLGDYSFKRSYPQYVISEVKPV